jgi:hypothetical protein
MGFSTLSTAPTSCYLEPVPTPYVTPPPLHHGTAVDDRSRHIVVIHYIHDGGT